MDKELIKKYKQEFEYWLTGGELLFKPEGKQAWFDTLRSEIDWSVKGTYVINDTYVQLRIALAEGKAIQHISHTTEEWVDFNKGFEPTPSYIFLATPEYYRIKPEEPKFKVGDWVIHNGVAKRVTKAVDGYIDSLDNEVAVIMKEESLELWEPEDEKYFWYKNDLVKFHETQANLGLLLESARGCSYYPAEKNFEDYCEPFIGNLPTLINK